MYDVSREYVSGGIAIFAKIPEDVVVSLVLRECEEMYSRLCICKEGCMR